MQSPLDAVVTIVIPHYNMVPLLLECLESVALQTVPAWEAIVVDDASTHGDVKKSISQVNDPRISLITLAQNQQHLSRSLRHEGGAALRVVVHVSPHRGPVCATG